MIALPNVTLCCIDTEHHVLSTVALRESARHFQFGKVVFITDRPEFCDPGWEFHRIARFEDYTQFNRFLLKNLHYHIDTEFVLMIQFDGFVLTPSAWREEFLQYDYIGAPWPTPRKEYAVGTGGFSLRSKRLLRALQDDRIVLPPDLPNEDLCMCRTYKSLLEVHHFIRFAPVELASQFCYESPPFVEGTFGFHALGLLADRYGDNPNFLIDNLQDYLMKKGQAVGLALRFAHREQHEAAARLFQRIRQYQTQEQARAHLQAITTQGGTMEFFDVAWPKYVA